MLFKSLEENTPESYVISAVTTDYITEGKLYEIYRRGEKYHFDNDRGQRLSISMRESGPLVMWWYRELVLDGRLWAKNGDKIYAI